MPSSSCTLLIWKVERHLPLSGKQVGINESLTDVYSLDNSGFFNHSQDWIIQMFGKQGDITLRVATSIVCSLAFIASGDEWRRLPLLIFAECFHRTVHRIIEMEGTLKVFQSKLLLYARTITISLPDAHLSSLKASIKGKFITSCVSLFHWPTAYIVKKFSFS